MTGNELLPPGAKPDGYKIVDSNSPMLKALVARDASLWVQLHEPIVGWAEAAYGDHVRQRRR